MVFIAFKHHESIDFDLVIDGVTSVFEQRSDTIVLLF